MDLPAWVRTARNNKKLTQEELGDALGVTKSNVSAWENGRHEPSYTQLRQIAALSGMALPNDDWQARSNDSSTLNERQDGLDSAPIPLDDNPDYPSIPRVKFKLSAGVSGFGVEYLQEDADPIVFRREWFRSRNLNPKNCYAIVVTGPSMEPGMWDGDTVVITTDRTTPKDGFVYAVNYEGELVMKRLIRDEGSWWLHSDNTDQNRHPRKRCHDGVLIIGEVVHKQSEHI
jgi:phage repressor protein C with HTH and peptisase S24 domain